VTDGAERLGSLAIETAPGHPLRGSDTALLRDLADQAVIAFRNARLSAELSHRVEELDLQTRALGESRRRLITAGDAERSRLERAVTRDVAPHLERMPAQFDNLARGAAGPVTAGLVQPLRAQAEAALEALREITRGVYPAQLGRSGLEPALRSLLGRTGGATLHMDAGTDLSRSEARVEAAAYFCVAEAVRDLGGPVEVSLTRREESLVVVIDGQDAGELPLANMRDRAEALGGTIASRRAEGRHSLEVWLPARVAAVVGIIG
jgi:signal transduction histidine kinase